MSDTPLSGLTMDQRGLIFPERQQTAEVTGTAFERHLRGRRP